MAKYIDAEKVIAALTDTLQYEGMVMDELISVVANIPTADVVERKTGKWIRGKCDQCGAHAPFWPMASTYYESDYCPNCGCSMMEEE